MKNINTKTVAEFIKKTLRTGKSELIEVQDSEVSYFRLLLSQFNKTSEIKMSAKRVPPFYMELSAPIKNKLNTDLLATVNELLVSPEKRIGPADFIAIKTYLNALVEICESKVKKEDVFIQEAEQVLAPVSNEDLLQ